MLVKPQKNKRRKLYHIYWGCDFFKSFEYYDYRIVNIKSFRGCLYYLDKPNLNKLKEIENKYHNTLILNGQKEYAPEIKFSCLFVAGAYKGV